jgi:O-methyltransferase
MKKKMYLDLLKKVLIDYHRIEYGEYKPLYRNNRSLSLWLLMKLDKVFRLNKLAICRKMESNLNRRINGKDWPAFADTMIGLKRLDNIEFCINKILDDDIKGDMIETGVWRGGATIFMKAMLKVNKVNDRIVWVADSFEGLPKANAKKYIADKNIKIHLVEELAVSLEVVKNNFVKYDLLDDNVKFLKGWFKDTLPTAPIEKLSLVRLDGDMYESTMDGLVNLYHKLSDGGFIIIDDYNAVKACKLAVNDFRSKHGIVDKIIPIDDIAVYWRKQSKKETIQENG